MKKKKYENVAELLYQVFRRAGKENLLQLAQLRKLWFQKVDAFLAGHAYPHDLLTTSHFFINPQCYHKEQEKLFSPALQKLLGKMKSKKFVNSQAFWDQLNKRLKVSLTPEEKTWLQQSALVKKQNLTLQLTVYDGTIKQTLHFNQKHYLSLFNQLLIGVHITAIESHVGDLKISAKDSAPLPDLMLKISSSSLESLKASKIPAKQQVQEIIKGLRKRSLEKQEKNRKLQEEAQEEL